FSNSTAYLYYRINITACVTASAPQIREFNVGVAYSPSQEVRVNGSTDGTATSTDLPGNNVETRIGSQVNVTNTPFNGLVAFVARWDRALPASELAAVEAEVTAKYLGAGSIDFAGTVAATSGVEGSISARVALDGTVAAVSGVEGAFESSGTVHPFAGQVDAVSGVEGTLTARVALAGQVDAVSVVQGSLDGDIPPTPMALSLTARASLTLAEPLSATLMAFDLTAKATLNVVMTRPTTIDPVTGLPQYRLVAVAADGTRLGELPNAEIGDLVEELGLDGTSVDFALPKYDATNRYVLPERGDPIPEVQVWRGPNLETWQKVDGARPTAATIEYDCSGLGTYLGDRLIGRIPKKDWLVNGDFSAGFTGWTFGYDEGSIPASQPKRSIVDVDFFGTKAKALKLSGADKITTTKRTLETAAVFVPNEATFLPGGAALVTSEAEQIPDGTASILIEGHTAYNWLDGDFGDGLALSLARANAAKPYVQAVHPDATITTVGKGRFEPLNDNSTYEEQAVNRRVEFHYSTTVTADADSAQWAKGSLTVGATYTNPKSTKRALPVTFFGWALLTNFLSESKTGYGVHVSIAKASAPTV
ncbi:MAG TPA: OmpA family protein, partial [Gaiellaceae bacterium]|nr:OmpA family protein [Gaiellaceae bacterium]